VKFRRCVVLVCLVFFVAAAVAQADAVVPGPDVTSSVSVRANASAQSASVGQLRPGDQAMLVGTVPNWYRVQLANGTFGFVSKRWTRIVTSTPLPPPPPPAAGPTFTIDVVDVGTGLGVLVRGPDFTLVYDAGSNDDQALRDSNRMLAFIKAVAPTTTALDHVILSHPHTDHVLLLADLFAAYQVRQVWDSGRLNPICGYRTFVQAIHDEPGVKYHNALHDFGTQDFAFPLDACGAAVTITLALSSVITTTPITLGQNATMTILHADGGVHTDVNENTLVVRLDLGGSRVLLMGDAPAGPRADPTTTPKNGSIEAALLACCTSDLAAQVMIAGHHGSMTSSRKAFLDAVGAGTFVISAGPKKYGPTVSLPDLVIVNELMARGQLFRTDKDDTACKTNSAKIGPDNDGQPGGCDNVRIVIAPGSAPQVAYLHGSD
jgi:beta-lactamase superfamily II metal-dependent hydrolase